MGSEAVVYPHAGVYEHEHREEPAQEPTESVRNPPPPATVPTKRENGNRHERQANDTFEPNASKTTWPHRIPRFSARLATGLDGYRDIWRSLLEGSGFTRILSILGVLRGPSTVDEDRDCDQERQRKTGSGQHGFDDSQVGPVVDRHNDGAECAHDSGAPRATLLKVGLQTGRKGQHRPVEVIEPCAPPGLPTFRACPLTARAEPLMSY